jgi:hypothetical protein
MIKLALIAALVLGAALMAYIRLAPSDPARWHEDPRLVARPTTPNFYLLRMVGGDALPPFFAEKPADLAVRVRDVALADGAQLLAGSVASGHMTFVSRTRLMGYPDYTSVLVERAEDGAVLLIFARARFGHSDLGVNQARVQRWLAALGQSDG